jgi:hypothetical protein
METYVMPSKIQMDPAIWNKLIAEVKEIIATGIELHEAPKKSFGVANMYRIRRNSRSAGSLIRRWQS